MLFRMPLKILLQDSVSAERRERRRKFHYVYIPPILAFTVQDSQPPWGSEVSVICHILLYCILLAYIVKHCIEEKVLKESPAI